MSSEAWKGKRGEMDERAAPRPTAYNPVETGRAWTHGFLNQKPWHPLSYRNQRRKYEAEQRYLQQERQREAAKKELELEEEHYKSLSYLCSQDVKEYRDRQQLAFMYVKPPGLSSISHKEKTREEKADVPVDQPQVYKERGPMLTMLQGRALCEDGGAAFHVGMDAPHGGFDPKEENQQLVFSDGEEETPTTIKRKRKKKQHKDKVKRAEAILAAAGYDVKAINKQIDKDAKKKKKRHRASRSSKH